jgi:hypothetical protein
MNDEAMVMAIGESGQYEPTPAHEVVEIEAVPLGAGNMVVPATVRWFSSIRDGGCVPTRLRQVNRPKAGVRQFVRVEFDCTPFARYTTDAGPVMGTWSSCMVRHLADAADPIFAGLTPREHARIRRAVIAGGLPA